MLVFAATIVAGIGCERSAPAGAGVVPPPATPHRIVVLSPALAVTLKDLGLAGEVAGRHAHDMVLDKSVPVCGDQTGIDYEALLGARPTHVLIEWGTRELPRRLGELAREHGWVVRSYGALLTLDQVRASVDDLGREFLAPEKQGAREKLLARLDASWARREELSKAGRVLLLMGTSPVCAALGPGSFHQQVLERIGGVPAIREGSPYMELDAEDVARLAPEGIVLVMPRAVGAAPRTGPLSADDAAARLGALATLKIPAVTNGRVWLIDDPLCLLPGTSLAGFADDLERGLARWSSGEKPGG